MERFMLEVLLPIGLILVPLVEAGVAVLISKLHAKTSKAKAEAERKEQEKQEQIDERILQFTEKHKIVTQENIGGELEAVHDSCRQKPQVEKLSKKIKELEGQIKILQENSQYFSRQLLCMQFAKYKERGWATIEEKREIEHIYGIYHSLGPNGVLEGKFKAFMELPDEIPETFKRRASDRRKQ